MLKTERNRIVILNALKLIGSRVKSGELAEVLSNSGHEMSERTVRLYLKTLEAEGLTQSQGRRGHRITEQGLSEARAAQAWDRVGYLSAKIDQMTYRMNFDLQTRSGSVVVNTSIVSMSNLAECAERMCLVFERGYAMGTLMSLLPPGERIGDQEIPEGHAGFCTVCSITLNGLLLKNGVPTASRFGGLVEMRGGKPVRFVEIIRYDGTRVDPLEVFIRSGMTDYHGAIRSGDGLIGASFRELPADSRDLVVSLADRLKGIGLGAFMRIGTAGQPVLGCPVGEGRIGTVVVGGLNPIAIVEESGYRTQSRALAGLLEFHRLFSYREFPSALERMMG
jgi:repressor of nif and glnA expression